MTVCRSAAPPLAPGDKCSTGTFISSALPRGLGTPVPRQNTPTKHLGDSLAQKVPTRDSTDITRNDRGSNVEAKWTICYYSDILHGSSNHFNQVISFCSHNTPPSLNTYTATFAEITLKVLSHIMQEGTKGSVMFHFATYCKLVCKTCGRSGLMRNCNCNCNCK